MNFFTKLFRSRDKPQNLCRFGGWPFMFGKSAAGQNVNEFTAIADHGSLRLRPHPRGVHRGIAASCV